jgi:hypothetical protein
MLDDFYEIQGWDRTTGLQRRSTLEDLGLADLAQRLAAAGKLAE